MLTTNTVFAAVVLVFIGLIAAMYRMNRRISQLEDRVSMLERRNVL